jgi:secreted trypsin-like serine protease
MRSSFASLNCNRKILICRLVVAIFAVTAFLACGTASAITNGTPDGSNHPYVGVVELTDGTERWLCSGSLLSQTLVLTAAHCTFGANAARVSFDPNPTNASTFFSGTPATNPNFSPDQRYSQVGGVPGSFLNDVGVIVLASPVPTAVVASYASLPAPGVVGTLANKAPLDLVGYGVNEKVHKPGTGAPQWDWTDGTIRRMYAPTESISGESASNKYHIKIAMNASQQSGGICFGDSGGPVLARGTNGILGLTSFVTNGNCAGTGYSMRVDIPEILAWISGPH